MAAISASSDDDNNRLRAATATTNDKSHGMTELCISVCRILLQRCDSRKTDRQNTSCVQWLALSKSVRLEVRTAAFIYVKHADTNLKDVSISRTARLLFPFDMVICSNEATSTQYAPADKTKCHSITLNLLATVCLMHAYLILCARPTKKECVVSKTRIGSCEEFMKYAFPKVLSLQNSNNFLAIARSS